MEAIFELLRKNGIAASGFQPENPAKRAKVFANFMAGLWFFYSIGAWYGAKFITPEAAANTNEPLLFGATFVVWFLGFFGHVLFDLIRKRIKYGS